MIIEYRYDDNDRLLAEACPEPCRRGGYTYSYDNNGNLRSKSGFGEEYLLRYDALNQLVQANISTPGGATHIDYVYDFDGVRVGKTVNGTNSIKYVVDKNRPYA